MNVKTKLIALVAFCDLPRHLACHCFGKKYTMMHKIIVGLCLMCVGYGIAEIKSIMIVGHILTDIGFCLILEHMQAIASE